MSGDRGVTLVELLVTLALVLVVASVLAQLAGEARAVFIAQPETVDLVQQARVGLEALGAELTHAGSGPWRTSEPGPLIRWIAPIHPRRLGPIAADPEQAAFSDRITLITVPADSPHTMAGDMASAEGPLPFQAGAACPPGDASCQFEAGQHLLVFDRQAAFRPFILADLAPPLLTPLDASLSKAWRTADEAQITAVRTTTVYFDAARRQLRRYDGHRSDLPIADDVTLVAFRYFGAPLPPLEPRPPPGGDNCVIDVLGAPKLPVLPADRGTLVELTLPMLSDGPWCGAPPYRYDADLLRVRSVRVRLRVQAESMAVRGVDSVRFTHPGTARGAAAEAPDLELTLDVWPRNLRVR
jgi:prepilin-type N-terminal cleavage/methylation domain-containing protein